MKKFIFLLVVTCITTVAIAQNGSLVISNADHTHEIIIKEGKRIRVTTKEGRKISGAFDILDPAHISIRSKTLALDDLAKMKKHPFLQVAILSGALYYSAILALAAGALIAIFDIGNVWPSSYRFPLRED